ncbi:DUF2971 domain-containing protein [Candidatus Phyllobacterium onerii]|uniref:DUF2971 domain-containing protein n=1 Tax=Candidatus Phyllobacterium onerii TaxID=3020828 RepID=UPI00232AC802|nr:DUF2971 domain-containing protein [Phyllobacterium sp. IY22]
MQEWDPVTIKTFSIFMPTAFERRSAITFDSRFVHYTTAENLFHILDSQEIWFRNAQLMNDHRDVEIGIAKVGEWLRDAQRRNALVETLEMCQPGIWQRGLVKYREWLPKIAAQTYVLSIAEHDPKEDTTGRLSMWRAFERDTIGVAAVVDVGPFVQMTETLQAYPVPVTYWTDEQLDDEFALVANHIASNRDFLANLPKAALVEMVFLTLVFAATCWKAPGLQDEREWRVLTHPQLWPSDRLFAQQRVFGAIPQTIYTLRLKNEPSSNLTGIELPELIKRVIIGPTERPRPIREALVEKLAAKNIADADSKVVTSGVQWRRTAMG